MIDVEAQEKDEAREKFTGKEFDDEGEENGVGGINLFHFGFREYDPEVGIWNRPDPMQEFTNSYSYVGGNPVDRVDPNGALSYPLLISGGIPQISVGVAYGYAVGNISMGGSSWATGMIQHGGDSDPLRTKATSSDDDEDDHTKVNLWKDGNNGEVVSINGLTFKWDEEKIAWVEVGRDRFELLENLTNNLVAKYETVASSSKMSSVTSTDYFNLGA
jgi:RHS repeat-associated protein